MWIAHHGEPDRGQEELDNVALPLERPRMGVSPVAALSRVWR